jgi:hypothetical protein
LRGWCARKARRWANAMGDTEVMTMDDVHATP